MRLPKDIQDFLAGYPDTEDKLALSSNIEFYSNTRRCQPDDMLISEIHSQWFGDYETLERRHGFIQWLFPIREHGLNFLSQPLQKHEVAVLTADPTLRRRVLRSYKLMLDFYGMQLISPETGLIGRVAAPRNYSTRYHNLIRSPHNYLRISRILKCLAELGLEWLNAGFLLHVLSEQSESNELNTAGIIHSMDHWWSNCIRNAEERAYIGDAIRKVRAGNLGFTRKMYVRALERRRHSGSFHHQGAST
ncbi:Opioid growth factor receptor (OGFr) conserved region domain containing protein [Amanita muscaria]